MAGLLDLNRQAPAGMLGGAYDFSPLDYPYTYGIAPQASELPGAEVRSRPDTVWPSHAFWDGLGISDPNWHRRMGQAQSALLGAVDLFGIPSAIMSRTMPDSVTAQPREMMAEHRNSALAGGLLGGVAGPMRGAYRAAGDALAAGGFGAGARMAADAGSAAGLLSLGDAIRGDQPNMDTASTAGMAAAGVRYAAPQGVPGILTRAGIGAAAGLSSGLPDAAEGRFDGLEGRAAAGAAVAAALKGRQADAMRPGFSNSLLAYLGIGAAPQLFALPGRVRQPDPELEPSAQARYPFGGY